MPLMPERSLVEAFFMKGLVDGIRYEERETDWIIFWISIRFLY